MFEILHVYLFQSPHKNWSSIPWGSVPRLLPSSLLWGTPQGLLLPGTFPTTSVVAPTVLLEYYSKVAAEKSMSLANHGQRSGCLPPGCHPSHHQQVRSPSHHGHELVGEPQPCPTAISCLPIARLAGHGQHWGSFPLSWGIQSSADWVPPKSVVLERGGGRKKQKVKIVHLLVLK